jgi:TRAP-type mannitol/chloroaromatic compound transport system permease small subunit
MVIVTLAVVVLRYGFAIGSVAMQESITYLHAAVFLLGAAYTLKRDGHVRVDIFYRSFSPTGQAWVNAIGGILFLLPLCAFIVYISWDFVAASWRIREASGNAGGIPAVFLLKSLIPLMAVSLAIQGVAETLKNLLILVEGSEDTQSEATQP